MSEAERSMYLAGLEQENRDLRFRKSELVGRVCELTGQIIIAKHDLETERKHADKWQQLAGRYDDIRYALRNCDDTPEGHAEFYRECAELIFGPQEDDQ